MFWPLDRPLSRWQQLAAPFRQARGQPAAPRQEAGWRRDPLSHPALARMTQRELGDLPFDPRAVAEE
jgi:hypothetical protein